MARAQIATAGKLSVRAVPYAFADTVDGRGATSLVAYVSRQCMQKNQPTARRSEVRRQTKNGAERKGGVRGT